MKWYTFTVHVQFANYLFGEITSCIQVVPPPGSKNRRISIVLVALAEITNGWLFICAISLRRVVSHNEPYASETVSLIRKCTSTFKCHIHSDEWHINSKSIPHTKLHKQ